MPIEFRCTQCNKLLRTPDNTAGKQAKCPECGALMTVPAIPTGTAPGSSFTSHVQEPAENWDADSSCESPVEYVQQTSQAYEQPNTLAAQRVSGPAIALIVTGALGLALQISSTLLNILQLGAVGVVGGQNECVFGIAAVPPEVGVVAGIVGIVLSSVVIIGAVKMRKLEGYGFAMASAVIAMIPCISPCCVLGLPFGIWAIVVLSDTNVRTAFRS